MDSLTQIVLGAAVSNAFLGKKLGNRSIVYGAIIATLPDLDVWIAKLFFDPITQVEIHRGVSHSILFYLILSLLLAYFLKKTESKNEISYKNSYVAIFFILLTHSILDIFTTWGTQIFWPFFDKIALKSIFVIDPLYTFPLLICLIFSMFKPKNNSKRYKWNNLGLTLSSIYLMITLFLQFIVNHKVINELDKQGFSYEKVVVKPTAMNTILWNIIIEKEDEFLLSEYSFFDSKPIQFEKHVKNHDYIDFIKNENIVKQLKHISEDQYIITKNDGNLIFNDLRFGLLKKDEKNIQYAFSYLIYEENNIWKASELPKEKRDGVLLLKNLFNRIKGN